MAWGTPSSLLMQTYYLYSAILALKLLALIPLASVMCQPERVQRANISDLKHLTPFWLVAALYMTTCPDPVATKSLLRVYVLARIISALGYILEIPRSASEAAFFASFAITMYMGSTVVYTYRKAL